ncbi:hypothetical protein HX109_07605 [Galbibacter sp. BG1]|uniref:hypothetical protein n=1 Tax=Galbibacter sp. BG1 TaxID=1170699 RepID=UPI0015B9DBCE|nr:hypothetical protein [Galbibacter sp. BG1]QLE01435.1 hypothetical protein HX109_07605 [Galbibacter sp. BG1]
MKIIFRKHTVLSTLFFLLFSLFIFAQEKVDMVTMTNGDIKEGKVTKITPNSISFVHQGEDLEYELAKKDIQEIKFSSGRVEVFNKTSSATNSGITSVNPSTGDKKNKIAILPFSIVSNDPTIQPDMFSVQVQNDCANILKDESVHGVKIQDAMTTNALLAKNNIDRTNVSTMLPAELANMLGVEYVLYGSAEVLNEGTTNYGSSGTTYKEKDDKKDRSKTETKGSVFTSTSTSSLTTYDVKLDLKIFNDQGNNIYSESRHPFGIGIDAYHSGLRYMLKRSPFGTKYKK